MVAVQIFGAITILGRKKASLVWLPILALIAITFLTTDTPPFAGINAFLHAHSALFHQIFRFPFTKFSLLAGFSLSLLAGVGLTTIFTFFEDRKHSLLVIISAIGAATSMIVVAFPIFQGKLFYPPLVQTLPEEYKNLMAYLGTKDPTLRIANVPQPTYWGWSYYRWGYTGSGFLWYGVAQPILDRAFDVWSSTDENYYWELSRAIYAKDAPSFQQVLDKYGVSILALDENILLPTNARALAISEIKELVGKLTAFAPTQTFGAVTIYERTLPIHQSFISVARDLLTIFPAYSWTDNDTAYAQIGPYIATSSPEGITYPFRELFTKRSVDERAFIVTETTEEVIIGSTRQATSAGILKASALAYEASVLQDLDPALVGSCGLIQEGIAVGELKNSENDSWLRLRAENNRSCLTLSASALPHKFGYLVAVESRHREGRPLLVAFINQTTKHTELETYLGQNTDWKTDYFVLPPLAPDGLGYTIYLANDSIGRTETINDIKRISFYKIPYQDMMNLRSPPLPITDHRSPITEFTVSHPNPAYYRILLNSSLVSRSSTLVLSQAFHPGWYAFIRIPEFPYLKSVGRHVLVNNWSNGWVLPSNQATIFIFFLPQLLEWIGFLLIPLPFLIARKMK